MRIYIHNIYSLKIKNQFSKIKKKTVAATPTAGFQSAYYDQLITLYDLGERISSVWPNFLF